MTHAIPKENGKWLQGVAPDDPLTSAATIAVTARLRFVTACLPLAAEWAEEDPEFVHQLRVGSRRASAAVAAFGKCLPHRRARKMRRALKRIRKRAGAARDLDVLRLRLTDERTTLSPGELDDVNRYLAECRAEAQLPILAIARALPPTKLEGKVSRLVRRIRWRGKDREPSVCDTGRRQMRIVTKEFGAAADVASSDGSLEALHSLRIAGKRLRYTIELFACVADGLLRQSVYPLVEELQERLGTMNDHAAAERYFRACAVGANAASLKGAFNRLANHELQSVCQSVDGFRRWWNSSRFREIRAGSLDAFEPPSAA